MSARRALGPKTVRTAGLPCAGAKAPERSFPFLFVRACDGFPRTVRPGSIPRGMRRPNPRLPISSSPHASRLPPTPSSSCHRRCGIIVAASSWWHHRCGIIVVASLSATADPHSSSGALAVSCVATANFFPFDLTATTCMRAFTQSSERACTACVRARPSIRPSVP